MKIKNIVTVFLVALILASCAPAAKVLPTETAVPLSTSTPIPPSPTIAPTLTVVPTPIGGGTLKVAYYASISNTDYLIVGDYFSGKINHRIRVRNISGQDNKISWSPDGAYLLFIDMAEHSTDDMKVNLLDTKTGKVTYLSTFPASYSTQWNTLSEVQWSTDSKYVLYTPWADSNQMSATSVASVDGLVQTTPLAYAGWLSDSHIMADTVGSIFDVEKKEETFNILNFRELGALQFTRDFILLEIASKDRVEAISYPENIRDVDAWQYDALMNSKVTMITFSPEITNPEIYLLVSIMDLPDHQISITGYGNFEVGDKSYTEFRVLVDRESLPAVVEEQNLYGRLEENGLPNESPAAFSPDGKLVLLVNVVLHDDNTFPHIKLTLQDMQGKELRVDEKLSQFNGITRIVVLPEKGIAFYWQP